MTEQQLQSKLVKYLESLGAYVVVTIKCSRAGVPDILACHKGKFYGIEVKLPGKLDTVSPIQQHNLELIRKASGVDLVITSLEQLKDYFEPSDEI